MIEQLSAMEIAAELDEELERRQKKKKKRKAKLAKIKKRYKKRQQALDESEAAMIDRVSAYVFNNIDKHIDKHLSESLKKIEEVSFRLATIEVDHWDGDGGGFKQDIKNLSRSINGLEDTNIQHSFPVVDRLNMIENNTRTLQDDLKIFVDEMKGSVHSVNF
jgi:hypothetical protein